MELNWIFILCYIHAFTAYNTVALSYVVDVCLCLYVRAVNRLTSQKRDTSSSKWNRKWCHILTGDVVVVVVRLAQCLSFITVTKLSILFLLNVSSTKKEKRTNEGTHTVYSVVLFISFSTHVNTRTAFSKRSILFFGMCGSRFASQRQHFMQAPFGSSWKKIISIK